MLKLSDCDSVYVGQTNDFDTLMNEIKGNGYRAAYCYSLLEGKNMEDVINYKDALISSLKTFKPDKIVQKGIDRTNGKILYAAFWKHIDNINQLHDDVIPIAKGFPLKLK